jgi:outer membrane immunogenic protein
MKCILTATTLILMTGSAFAADAWEREGGSPATFSWSGLYAGIHLGYADGSSDLFIDGGGPLFNASVDPSGFIGGVQIGVNHQLANGIVLGAEVDATYNGVDGMAPIPAANAIVASDVEWSGSARLRAGYAFDRTMPYVTGGIAAANYKLDLYSIPSGNSATIHSETHIGWTAGAGVEQAFTDRWTARIEYRYSDFGEEILSTVGGLIPDGNVDLSTHDVRVGLNYRF